MAQTKFGAAKARANKIGIPVVDLLEREKTEKWCWYCREWRDRGRFNTDKSRYDGLSARCQDCTRVRVRICTKGRPSPMRGKQFSEEARKNMGGDRGVYFWKGKSLPEDMRARVSAATRANTKRGPEHYAWKDGSRERQKCDRRRPEYQDWRSAVFQRDGFTCQKCGDAQGGNLRAHHIKPYADFPELRLDVGNCITLCHDCHELEHYKPNSTRNLRKARRGERLV